MSLNQFVYSLFFGMYFLGLDPPNYIGKYVMKNDIETDNQHIKHVVTMIKNGDWKSPELKVLVIKSLG